MPAMKRNAPAAYPTAMTIPLFTLSGSLVMSKVTAAAASAGRTTIEIDQTTQALRALLHNSARPRITAMSTNKL
jgi:hypothetical protein